MLAKVKDRIEHFILAHILKIKWLLPVTQRRVKIFFMYSYCSKDALLIHMSNERKQLLCVKSKDYGYVMEQIMVMLGVSLKNVKGKGNDYG